MTFKPLYASWKSYVESHGDTDALPATLGTPEQSWAYGAATELVETDGPAVIRITAKALKGKIGFCLISEDYSSLASNQVMISPESGEATVELKFAPEKSPARLLVRNYNDKGKAGEVEVSSIEIDFIS
jgi:hypothetical protein